MTEKLHWKDVTIDGLDEWERNFLDRHESDSIIEFFTLPQVRSLEEYLAHASKHSINKKDFIATLECAKEFAEYVRSRCEYLIQREQSDYEF